MCIGTRDQSCSLEAQFYNAKELKNSKAPELFRIHSFLSEAYEAAEAGNFQVAERLQSLFMSPYDEHPEDGEFEMFSGVK